MLKSDLKSPPKIKIISKDKVATLLNNGFKKQNAAPVIEKTVSQKTFAEGLQGTLFAEKLKERGIDEKELEMLNKSDVFAKIVDALKPNQPKCEKNKGTAIPWEDTEIQLLIGQHLDKKINAKQLREKIGETLGRAPPAKSTLSKHLKDRAAGKVSSYATTMKFEIAFSKKLQKNLIVTRYPECRAFVQNKVVGTTKYFRCYSCDKSHADNLQEEDTRATAILTDSVLRYKMVHHPSCASLNEPELEALLIVRQSRDTLRNDKTILPKQAYEKGKKEANAAGEAVNYYEPYHKYRSGHARAANFTNVSEEEEVKKEGFKKELKSGCWVINSNKNNKLYSSPEQLEFFSKCKKAVSDATFSPAPRKFKQVWSLHGLYEREDGSREWVVVATAIMKRKTYGAYKQVIGWIKQAMIDRGLKFDNIERIHVDFERAQYNAFKYHFGDIIYGCSFHLAQGVIRNAQKIGLMRFYFIDEVRRWVRGLMALNMLPYEHAVRLFNLHFTKPPKKPKGAKKWPEKKHFTDMITYFKRTWLTDKLKISFYGLRIVRNINAAEAFNGKLQRDPHDKEMDTKPTVRKYVEMDRILFEREEQYEQNVVAKYDQLSDDEFRELAYTHVRRCSCLLQRVKQTKAVLKKIIDEEITNKKDGKVVPTDDENDENVDNVEHSRDPDIFDEIDAESESESEQEESEDEGEDKYTDSDESDNDFDAKDDFEESYIHSDFQPKKFNNDSPSFEKPSPVQQKNSTYVSWNDFDSPQRPPSRLYHHSLDKKPSPSQSNRYQSSLDDNKISTFSRHQSSFGQKSNQSFGTSNSKRKADEDDVVVKYKHSKTEQDLINISKSTEKGNTQSSLIFDADLGMPSFQFKFSLPKDTTDNLFELLSRLINVHINIIKEQSPLLKMPTAAIIGSPTSYFNPRGDGNCGYRSVSHAFFGTDAYHWEIRKYVTKYRSFNGDVEGIRNWDIIKHQDARSTAKERHLWMNELDLIAIAKVFLVNVLSYKILGDHDGDHWVCFGPGNTRNDQQDEKMPDVLIAWSLEDEHFKAVTAIEKIM